MKQYKKILLATDFSEGSMQAMARAKDLAGQYQALLSVLHVAEYVPMLDPANIALDPFNLVAPDQIVYDAAIGNLMEIGESLGIPDDRLIFENGQAKDVIVRVAGDQNADLIVISTRGDQGIGSLLGSTAASVILHAPCDVLVVKQTA